MASVSIRNIPDDVYKALRVQAAEAGESMEAYLRRHLSEIAHGGPVEPMTIDAVQARMREAFGENGRRSAVDELIDERRREAAQEEAETWRNPNTDSAAE